MPSPPDGVGSDPVRATTVVYPPKGDQDTTKLNLGRFHYLTILLSGPLSFERSPCATTVPAPGGSTRRNCQTYSTAPAWSIPGS